MTAKVLERYVLTASADWRIYLSDATKPPTFGNGVLFLENGTFLANRRFAAPCATVCGFAG
ncbi:MAG: hypothetical protein A2Y10_14900 [Planctomycetes bacterium GWF2_41_51]|nr:MAG: hypothetical protein A2Y10_14900 [Planctomycetes bacterium GWF2_41_51]